MMIYGKMKTATLSVTYTDDSGTTSKDFETLKALLLFLKENREIAEKVKFDEVVKRKQ